MLFSQRKGLKPVKNVIQTDVMDAELRNGPWSVLCLYYWQDVQGGDFGRNSYSTKARTAYNLCQAL